MRFAILQINSVIGDVHRNCEKIKSHLEKNKDRADLFITPEQALIGYPARDYLSQTKILLAERDCLESLRAFTKQHHIALLIGHCEARTGTGRPLYNVATLFDSGNILGRVRKRRLPSYDIFEEERFFEPGSPNESSILPFRGLKLGVSVCEDAWTSVLAFGVRDVRGYPPITQAEKADVLVNLSASPYSVGKRSLRKDLICSQALRQSTPAVYSNSVGGQDDILFDGNSFFVDAQGNVSAEGAAFREDIAIATLKNGQWSSSAPKQAESSQEEEIFEALACGTRDFVRKSGGQKVLLGLSGGIDSALCAAIAAHALGPENVLGVSLPSTITSDLSKTEAREVAARLQIEFREIPITSTVESTKKALSSLPESGLAAENLQSRTRALILNTLANSENRFLLSTGNKSELAMGYATLYGDMCGALCPLGDLYKTEVYAVSHSLNRRAQKEGRTIPIPQQTLQRPPTAELAPGQKDSDSLPEYPVLDGILRELIENQGETIFPEEQWDKILQPRFTVASLRKKYLSQEFKRRQAPPILKIHQRSFGSGWKMPICKGLP